MAELDAEDRKKLPAKKFAEPKKRAYPIEDKAHARHAKAGAGRKREQVRSPRRRTPC
jgi:hypothetical protein